MTNAAAKPFADQEEKNFHKALIEQGHLFQHRALWETLSIFGPASSKWEFQALEFPVSAKSDTRIDFILREQEVYLAVECKRVNPAYGRWLFVTAPVRRNPKREDQIIYEGISKSSADHTRVHVRKISWSGWPVCQIGYQVKLNKSGDMIGHSQDVVEKTLRQAAMGACGLINYFSGSPGAVPPKTPYFVIPVVFTTAELVTAHLDGEVDLADGTVKADELKFKKEKWILYEYHVEPGLRQPIHDQLRGDTLSEVLDQKYTRTIPVVTASAIAEFLTAFHHGMLK